MKKFISIFAIIALLAAALVVPTSAAEPLNVMTKVIDDTTIVDGIKTVGYVVEYSNRIPANMFDGLVDYHENVPGSYAGFKTSVKAAEINDGTAPRYNVMGETGKDDSIYLGVLYFELNKVYTVDSLAIYSSQYAAPVTTAPAQTPATADSAVILVAYLVMSAAVVVALRQRKRFN